MNLLIKDSQANKCIKQTVKPFYYMDLYSKHIVKFFFVKDFFDSYKFLANYIYLKINNYYYKLLKI